MVTEATTAQQARSFLSSCHRSPPVVRPNSTDQRRMVPHLRGTVLAPNGTPSRCRGRQFHATADSSGRRRMKSISFFDRHTEVAFIVFVVRERSCATRFSCSRPLHAGWPLLRFCHCVTCDRSQEVPVSASTRGFRSSGWAIQVASGGGPLQVFPATDASARRASSNRLCVLDLDKLICHRTDHRPTGAHGLSTSSGGKGKNLRDPAGRPCRLLRHLVRAWATPHVSDLVATRSHPYPS